MFACEKEKHGFIPQTAQPLPQKQSRKQKKIKRSRHNCGGDGMQKRELWAWPIEQRVRFIFEWCNLFFLSFGDICITSSEGNKKNKNKRQAQNNGLECYVEGEGSYAQKSQALYYHQPGDQKYA